MEGGFRLVSLAGEAEVGVRTCGRVHPAERQICGLPDLCPRRVGCKGWPSDVVSADVVDSSALDHCDGCALKPDIFAQQGAGVRDAIIFIFRNPVTIQIVDGVDLDRGLPLIPLEFLFYIHFCFIEAK